MRSRGVSNVVLFLCLPLILILLFLHVNHVEGSDIGVVEGGETEHAEPIEGTDMRGGHETRRLVIRHVHGKDTTSRLEELGFVIEDVQEEVSYVVRGGSDSAIEELRSEGARVAHRPVPPTQRERLLERKRSDARRARIQLHEARHDSLLDARLRSADTKKKEGGRKQWRTPMNAEDTSRRSAGMTRERRRHVPLSENAALKRRASRDAKLREEAATRQTSSKKAGPFAKKSPSHPLRKLNSNYFGRKPNSANDDFGASLKAKRQRDVSVRADNEE